MSARAAPPVWVTDLSVEDVEFLRRFVLASGSLKALATEYRVSYPTIRLRLDRVIDRVKASETLQDVDPMTRKIRHLIAEGALDPAAGKALLDTYAQTKRGPES